MKTVSMKPVVQKPRKDGFWAVYIRFTLDGRCQFWKTSKVVSSQNVKSKSEITDPCAEFLQFANSSMDGETQSCRLFYVEPKGHCRVCYK